MTHALVTVLLFAAPAPRAAELPQRHVGNQVALDPLGLGTWIVREELDSVQWVPVAGEQERIAVCPWPQQIVVDGAGRAFVSCRGDGTVGVIELGKPLRTIHVGGEPMPLALDASEETLFVGLLDEPRVVAIDARTLEVSRRVDVGVVPQSLACTRAGLVVLPLRDASRLMVLRETGALVALPLDAMTTAGRMLLTRGDGLVVMRARANPIQTQRAAQAESGYGAGELPPETIVADLLSDMEGFRVASAGSIELGVSDVSGAAILPDGRLAYVSRADGVECEVAFDGPFASSSRCDDPRLEVGFVGLTASAWNELVTVGSFSHQLERFRVASFTPDGKGPSWAHESIALEGPPTDAQLERGRQLFFSHEPTEGQTALACHSCHPDGRDDGLVWAHGSFERTQTPTLAGRVDRPGPFMWRGSARTLEASLAGTLKRLGRAPMSRKDTRALAQFLRKGLRPLRLPALGAEQERLAERGKALFESSEVGCAECHPADQGFTDHQVHDVDSVSGEEAARIRVACRGKSCPGASSFLTPGLHGVATSAPYLHDGSRATLDDLFGEHNVEMGHTTQLTSDERAALLAYVRTL